MATTQLTFRLGNTWTPVVTITAPFSLDTFTATAGLYDKPSRIDGTLAVAIDATVVAVPSVDGGTIELLLSAAAQEAAITATTFSSGIYYLSVQLNRASDGYVHEIEYNQTIVSGDTII